MFFVLLLLLCYLLTSMHYSTILCYSLVLHNDILPTTTPSSTILWAKYYTLNCYDTIFCFVFLFSVAVVAEDKDDDNFILRIVYCYKILHPSILFLILLHGQCIIFSSDLCFSSFTCRKNSWFTQILIGMYVEKLMILVYVVSTVLVILLYDTCYNCNHLI